ncbi:hypothetical protein LSAT2_015703 [Lamellibrachia satsuma]|nr:hypothetical protein LSAT2_015703 [Lamellibrachia satsuma]
MICDVYFGIGHWGKTVSNLERDCQRTKASALYRVGGGIEQYVAACTDVDRVTAAETTPKQSVRVTSTRLNETLMTRPSSPPDTVEFLIGAGRLGGSRWRGRQQQDESTSQGSCIFPCRCTDGCNTTTGDCLNGGQCEDGHPSGYRWTGTACQTDADRLNKFILSVGNSSDRATHAGVPVTTAPSRTRVCQSQRPRGRWSNSQQVVYSGRPLPQLQAGWRTKTNISCSIACQHCPSTSACNDVIGCAVCAPGKQQPDCVKACDRGTYGKNCEEDCGHCKDIQQCDVTNGHCTTGCETWYTSDVCKSYVRSPYYKTSDKPIVEDVTSSSVVVSWPKTKTISIGLEIHYYYIVWLQTGGGTFINVSRILQLAGLDRLQSRITGLTFNTNYSVKIEPYRQQKERRQNGTSTGVTLFKTSCKAPDTPTIEKVKTATTKGCALASIFVIWEVLRYTGCGELVAVGALYKRQASTNGQWSYKKVERVTNIDLAITDLAPEMYEVKVTATNNEGLTSISDSITVNLLTTSSSQSTENKAPVAAGLGTGPVIGVAVSTFVLGGLVTAVILINVMRMRLNKSNADFEEEQREQPSIELGGEVTQDENEYEPMTAVPRQQEYVNVNIYDVIQN